MGVYIMIWGIISFLIAFWLVGLFLRIGGIFIHIFLVVAVAVFIYNLMSGRKK
ncbi:MAG TPA: lmo0937 family membrane protein [Patescibacteria group bacterium]|nr:lmo0937 family membrane protein [Patescibacteria group bacterium]